ncbi:MAG: hypothetical protein ACOCRX_05570 [Candidatus Woesearchaeota archaeon]
MEREGRIIVLITILICLVIGVILSYYILQAPHISKTLFGDEIGETFAFTGIFFLLIGVVMSVMWLVDKANI